jgi:hypothetical protein
MKQKIFVVVLLSSLFISCGVTDNHKKESPSISENFLVLYIPFDNSFVDKSDLGNNLETYDVELTTDRFGKKNSACLFNGKDSFIKIKDSDYLSPCDNKISVSLWAKSKELRNWFLLYKGSNTNNREYAIGLSPDSLLSFQINNYGSRIECSSTYSADTIREGKWYHIVGTWDGIAQKIYINGELVNIKYPKISIKNLDSDLFIGTYGGDINKYDFKGAIDDVLIFNRVLSEEEVKILYNSGEEINFK